MPSMPQAKFHHKAKNGEKRSLVCKVYVDVEGEFHVTFDKDLLACAEASLRDGTRVTFGKTLNPRITGRNLDHCKEVVSTALRQWLQCEVSEEHVIRYGFITKATYWKMPNGAIYANGCDRKNDPDYDDRLESHDRKNGTWYGNLNATSHNNGYMVSLFAKITKKTTYSRGDVAEVKYGMTDFDNFSHTTYGERLDNFIGIHESSDWHSPKLVCEEMPYTEEAAKFFYDILIGMCTFADKIESFFEDKENVMLAIASGGRLLVAPKVDDNGQ